MTDTKNRSRQPAGVPVGGEFAKESGASTGVSLVGGGTGNPASLGFIEAGSELGAFTLDGENYYAGWDSGETWNGADQPWLTQESMERLAQDTAAMRAEDDECVLVYRAQDGTWMTDEGIGVEEHERHRPIPMRTYDGQKGAYQLSSWMFTRVEEPDAEDVEARVDDSLPQLLATVEFSSAIVTDELETIELDAIDAPLSQHFQDSMREDLTSFLTSNHDLITLAKAARPDYTDQDIAGDFWYTRNGHGVGFWDRGLGEVGKQLSEATKPYGEVSLYLHDGEITAD